jgi:hypothetical protein
MYGKKLVFVLQLLLEQGNLHLKSVNLSLKHSVLTVYNFLFCLYNLCGLLNLGKISVATITLVSAKIWKSHAEINRSLIVIL